MVTTMPELLQLISWLLHAYHGCYNQMCGCNNLKSNGFLQPRNTVVTMIDRVKILPSAAVDVDLMNGMMCMALDLTDRCQMNW